MKNIFVVLKPANNYGWTNINLFRKFSYRLLGEIIFVNKSSIFFGRYQAI